MGMKKTKFTPKNELQSGKRLDTESNTMKKLSFDNWVLVCFDTSPFDTWHHFNVYKFTLLIPGFWVILLPQITMANLSLIISGTTLRLSISIIINQLQMKLLE